MEVIVYVETNFLMSVAMGREERGHDLLSAVSASIRGAIPTSCYMEAFSAFEDEQKRRRRFQEELNRQIGQLKRDITSRNARDLFQHLEDGRVANSLLLNDVQDRLYRFVERAVGVLLHIPESAAIVGDALNSRIIDDPTDNLILHAILDHARGFPEAHKVMLTENARDFDAPEVHEALAAAGVERLFRSATNLLGWLGSLSA